MKKGYTLIYGHYIKDDAIAEELKKICEEKEWEYKEIVIPYPGALLEYYGKDYTMIGTAKKLFEFISRYPGTSFYFRRVDEGGKKIGLFPRHFIVITNEYTDIFGGGSPIIVFPHFKEGRCYNIEDFLKAVRENILTLPSQIFNRSGSVTHDTYSAWILNFFEHRGWINYSKTTTKYGNPDLVFKHPTDNKVIVVEVKTNLNDAERGISQLIGYEIGLKELFMEHEIKRILAIPNSSFENREDIEKWKRKCEGAGIDLWVLPF